ncbi:MAG: BON domain-containing protein, partial [Pseudomonadota bacterium]
MRILILLAVLLLAPLGAMAQTDQPTGTITAEGSAQSDAVIAQRLRDIMAELGGYEDVTVTVSSGIVTYRGTTLDPADTARLTAIAGRVEGVVAIENDVTETGDVVRRLDPVRDRLLDRIDQGIALLPLILIALIVFLIVLILGLLLARRPMFSRLAPNAFIADIYRMVVRLVFGVLGLVLALDILNATALLSTILGAAGIIGLAVGF